MSRTTNRTPHQWFALGLMGAGCDKNGDGSCTPAYKGSSFKGAQREGESGKAGRKSIFAAAPVPSDFRIGHQKWRKGAR